MIVLRRYALAIGLVVLAAFVLLLMGRKPICTCGYVKLWHGVVFSSENSQHVFDWYTPSHIIHGFLFYGLTWLMGRNWSLSLRLAVAVAIEGAWEVFENTDFIINRYREATIALDYYGDSALNSVSDILAMMAGFFFARKAPILMTIAVALFFEFTTGYLIRDNLTLNVLMLLWPLESVKAWQGGG